MTRRTLAIALAVVVTGLLARTFAAVDITGKWTAASDTQIGVQKYTYTFQVKGSELTGTAASDLGTTVIKNGKVDGDTVSEDQIDFTRQVADVATEKLVAKRVK